MENLTKSVIPPNVRDQYDIEIQKWKEEDKLYSETHSFQSVMVKVRNQPFLTFVGVPGSGKSATAHHIALKLQEEGYEVVPTKDVRKLEDYGDIMNPQVFVIDDVVGVFGLQETELNMLTKYENKITKPCMVKSKTLMTCRETVFNETLHYKPFFTKDETLIKLHSSDHTLDNDDKKQIFQKYGLNKEIMSPALLTSTSDMFPLLCKLFSKDAKFQALGFKFFLNPVQCIIDELDNVQRHNKLNYATLVLCMLNENCLSKYILEDQHNENFKSMKIDTLRYCELESRTDVFKFMKALSAMEGTYTKYNDARYTFIHDSMFEICAYHYGKQFPEQILLHMSSSYIANYVKLQTSERGIAHEVKEKQSDSQSSKGDKSSNDSDRKTESGDKRNNREESFDLCIRLREEQYPLLAERLYRDIQNMNLFDVFRNPVLKHPQVCQAFIGVLGTKSYTEIKFLFLFSHGKVHSIESKRDCVQKESEGRRKEGGRWRQKLLVDFRRKRDDRGKLLTFEYTCNVRVISWVIYYGHCLILEYIMQQIEQHNEVSELFEIGGNSPNQPISGISTCHEQEIEHCRVVGKSKSVIFKTIKKMISSIIMGNSPYQSKTTGIYTYNKCEREFNRFIEQCRLLVLSCFSDNVQTVKVVLPLCKKAINGLGQISEDIEWYSDTPLTAACGIGNVGIVMELLKAGADVNLEDKWKTPLITACASGHVSVVEELVKAGADVNQQCIGIWVGTPLIIACFGGYVSIVKMLVNVGADINMQDNHRSTALLAACELGHASVAKELMKAGADVNLQSKWETPMIAAVREGSLSTVKDLVEHGADLVTQVVDIKLSVVYKALIMNKPDMIKYLIQEHNKMKPGKFTGNVHLLNSLMEIRHARVKTDSRDDVVITDRSVWYMDHREDLWKTIKWGDCDALRRLLCLGLDVNQLIHMYYDSMFCDLRPLLYKLIEEQVVCFRTEKVRILLEAGADVNVRMGYDYHTLLIFRNRCLRLDREGVSVLERTRRLLNENIQCDEFIDCKFMVSEYKKLICEIKKHVRRHSV